MGHLSIWRLAFGRLRILHVSWELGNELLASALKLFVGGAEWNAFVVANRGEQWQFCCMGPKAMQQLTNCNE